MERETHPLRVRRVVLWFLLILTLVVFARIASSAEGGMREPARSPAPAITFRLEEPAGIVAAGTTFRRTLALGGLRGATTVVEIAWEARISGRVAAAGRAAAPARKGEARVVIAVPVPPLDSAAGLDLGVQVLAAGGAEEGATFPFVVYPGGLAPSVATQFAKARVALFDPGGTVAPPLAVLGIHAEEFDSYEGLALWNGDLIVIGPGGFTREREGLGPILAARARSGVRLLVLDQPNLPGTLSEDLRLWPSFTPGSETVGLVAVSHPVVRGLSSGDRAALATIDSRGMRPLLPPTRGNFRVISEMRIRSGPSWQEGVTLLELPVGSGTILASQSTLSSSFVRLEGARLALAQSLAYLLEGGRTLKRVSLYGASLEDLPACLARFSPQASRAADDLSGAEALLAAGDWHAPHAVQAAHLPPPAEVARYLREGGTLLLFNPQPLALDYLQGLDAAGALPDPTPALFEGIAPDDLSLLGEDGRPALRLRAHPGQEEVSPLLITTGIAQYRVGRGLLVAISLPDLDACARPRTSSILARLLTNLGIPLDHSPGIDPDAVSRLEN